MLTQENNRILCSVGAGTPVGELFRSLWLPAVPSSQLPAPNGPPVRLKLLGEELVAFRDGAGQIGIVQANCAHRLAPLFFGKVENAGIRCSYHGWLFDRGGQCLEIPSDPNGTVCRNIKLKAYATQEKADVVWVYMGTGTPPALPKFPWIDLPKSQRIASVWLQETNWFQGVEGEIDSSHVSILHKSKGQVDAATLVHPAQRDPDGRGRHPAQCGDLAQRQPGGVSSHDLLPQLRSELAGTPGAGLLRHQRGDASVGERTDPAPQRRLTDPEPRRDVPGRGDLRRHQLHRS